MTSLFILWKEVTMSWSWPLAFFIDQLSMTSVFFVSWMNFLWSTRSSIGKRSERHNLNLVQFLLTSSLELKLKRHHLGMISFFFICWMGSTRLTRSQLERGHLNMTSSSYGWPQFPTWFKLQSRGLSRQLGEHWDGSVAATRIGLGRYVQYTTLKAKNFWKKSQ